MCVCVREREREGEREREKEREEDAQPPAEQVMSTPSESPEHMHASNSLSREYGTYKTVKARFWPWL